MKRDSEHYHLYVITNRIDKKKYVGITNNPDQRWIAHRSMAKKSDKPLYRAMRAHGRDNFVFSLLCSGPKWVILNIEEALIAYWHTQCPRGYNISPGGELPYSPKGIPKTKAHRCKISRALQGQVFSPDRCAKIAAKAEERMQDPERRQKAVEILRVNAANPEVREASRLACSRPVEIHGIRYRSIREAAKALGIKPVTLGWRLRHGKNPTG